MNVYFRFDSQNPKNHTSKDSMTNKEVEGVYCFSLSLENPYMSDSEIMELAKKKAQQLYNNDCHAWGYAKESEGMFWVFEGNYVRDGRDGQIAEVENIIGNDIINL